MPEVLTEIYKIFVGGKMMVKRRVASNLSSIKLKDNAYIAAKSNAFPRLQILPLLQIYMNEELVISINTINSFFWI